MLPQSLSSSTEQDPSRGSSEINKINDYTFCYFIFTAHKLPSASIKWNGALNLKAASDLTVSAHYDKDRCYDIINEIHCCLSTGPAGPRELSNESSIVSWTNCRAPEERNLNHEKFQIRLEDKEISERNRLTFIAT